jgi:predicted transcriptional regulator of viral defense system
VKAVEAYGDLVRMGQPVMTTREASNRWQTDRVTAGRRLRAIEAAGLARHLRRGLWSLDSTMPLFALAPYLTAPFPAYVSLWSALAHHGVIEQIPRQISVASLGRPRQIETSIGTFDVHRLAGEVFGGFDGSGKSGYVAAPEKALFDIVYVRAAAGKKAYFPELSLPRNFDRGALESWTDRISSPRLRAMVSRRLRESLKGAATD